MWQDEQTNFHMMDHGYPVVDGSTYRTYHSCRHFLPVIVEMKTVAQAWSPGPWCPGAGICCKLSDSVCNSDWWKIRKTDCMGWWTAVSKINRAICDPAELTIVSAERLLFQTLVVILPPSRMLVRCQLRAETPRAPPYKQGYVWNDVKISRPNNKIDMSLKSKEVCSILWICLQNHCNSSKAEFSRMYYISDQRQVVHNLIISKQF